MTTEATGTSRNSAASDPIQNMIATYAGELAFAELPREVVDAATTRLIDTIGSALSAVDAEPCVIARRLATEMYPSSQATILGTRETTTLDMAAFANGIAGRFAEMNDTYHRPGQAGGHPSDVVLPLLSVAEHRHASGTELLTAVVVAYEIMMAMMDSTNLWRTFDYTTHVGLGVAVGAARLMKLDVDQIREAISLVIVPNNPLRRSRIGDLTMWKAGAIGQAGRAGVFAALLAETGMPGPTLPFVGEAGWNENVARADVTIDGFGGAGRPYRIVDTIIKPRGACGTSISSILAAERAHVADRDLATIVRVVVETYEEARYRLASEPVHWNPQTRESADHSIPYVVAAGLADGLVGPEQFDDAHLRDPRIRKLLDVIEVVENPDFTHDYEHEPFWHRTRVTVHTDDGQTTVGEIGGEHGDLYESGRDFTDPKFVNLAQAVLAERASEALERLWTVDQMDDAAVIPTIVAPS